MKNILEEHWHHLPEAEVLHFLETESEQGLDTFEVRRRQEEFGPNSITQKKGKSPLLLFLLQFHQPLVYILLAAGAVTCALREWVDSGVIFGVVLFNAIIGFIQEAKAVKAIEALAHSMSSVATVLCGGEKRTFQDREQWASGCNFAAMKPGVVLSYSRNEATLREMERAGYHVVPAVAFLTGETRFKKDERVVITFEGSELVRGGGGPRCMTCPVQRDDPWS